MTIPFIEENDQTQARKEHLEKLRSLVGNVYPNKFDRTAISGAEDTITNLVNFARPIKEKYVAQGEQPTPEAKDAANAELNQYRVRTSGRLAVPPRVMGKAAFVHLSDGVERLQIYVRKQDVKAISNDNYQPIETENSGWDLFNLLDHGDFVGVEGYLFVTKTGELSIHVETIQFLAKAMLPMPDKMHGIEDPETRRRYRYIDLIASSLKVKTPEELEEEKRTGNKILTTREVFERRARLISGMRNYLDAHGYIEVETPMLTPKATGAAAKPFKTHHNALDIDLYARIAPELYLKRLEVGGFEKVYELNRNFRNEGLSQRHNPEFTMLEFYCAYMDVNGMMDFAEEMIKEAVNKATGSLLITYANSVVLGFMDFRRLTMKQAVIERLKEILPIFESEWLEDEIKIRNLVVFSGQYSTEDEVTLTKEEKEFISVRNSELKSYLNSGWKVFPSDPISHRDSVWYWETQCQKFNDVIENSEEKDRVLANSLIKIFENVVEPNLIQPTFIIDYPKAISPLSKASPQNPQIAERFELFINGMECANGFSELNDPQEQYERFLDQARERERGDDEAMVLDEDYIRALSYGMPPAAGIGIGIDRLVMLLTNQHSIRDVILFPHMRPERGTTEEQENNTGQEKQ
ncbi:MAG: lysine--tRNA ligase [Acidobacteriota bacterium]|nr:lysine--tRNA ligase [Acidobacteriota bacterium]